MISLGGLDILVFLRGAIDERPQLAIAFIDEVLRQERDVRVVSVSNPLPAPHCARCGRAFIPSQAAFYNEKKEFVHDEEYCKEEELKGV